MRWRLSCLFLFARSSMALGKGESGVNSLSLSFFFPLLSFIRRRGRELNHISSFKIHQVNCGCILRGCFCYASGMLNLVPNQVHLPLSIYTSLPTRLLRPNAGGVGRLEQIKTSSQLGSLFPPCLFSLAIHATVISTKTGLILRSPTDTIPSTPLHIPPLPPCTATPTPLPRTIVRIIAGTASPPSTTTTPSPAPRTRPPPSIPPSPSSSTSPATTPASPPPRRRPRRRPTITRPRHAASRTPAARSRVRPRSIPEIPTAATTSPAPAPPAAAVPAPSR